MPQLPKWPVRTVICPSLISTVMGISLSEASFSVMIRSLLHSLPHQLWNCWHFRHIYLSVIRVSLRPPFLNLGFDWQAEWKALMWWKSRKALRQGVAHRRGVLSDLWLYWVTIFDLLSNQPFFCFVNYFIFHYSDTTWAYIIISITVMLLSVSQKCL